HHFFHETGVLLKNRINGFDIQFRVVRKLEDTVEVGELLEDEADVVNRCLKGHSVSLCLAPPHLPPGHPSSVLHARIESWRSGHAEACSIQKKRPASRETHRPLVYGPRTR